MKQVRRMKQSVPPVFGLALSALMGLPAAMLSGTAGAAIVTHHYDRSSAYSRIWMCRPGSSGESLADVIPARPAIQCVPDADNGDILVNVSWQDGSAGSGIWSPDAGNGNPGVTVASATGGHSARLSQTGDTFSDPAAPSNLPWTLSNLSTGSDINEVVMTALGTPDMGFDTDDGSAPFHGEAGFPLFLDALSVWDGTVDVYYDFWNNWNGTTDIFHRMRLAFSPNTPVVSGANMVFYQDTDEIPVPPAALLLLTGMLGIAAMRRRERVTR